MIVAAAAAPTFMVGSASATGWPVEIGYHGIDDLAESPTGDVIIKSSCVIEPDSTQQDTLAAYNSSGEKRWALTRGESAVEAGCGKVVFDESGTIFTDRFDDAGPAAINADGSLKWHMPLRFTPLDNRDTYGFAGQSGFTVGLDHRIWSIVRVLNSRFNRYDAYLVSNTPSDGAWGSFIETNESQYTGGFAPVAEGVLAATSTGATLHSYTGDMLRVVPLPDSLDRVSGDTFGRPYARSTDNGLVRADTRCEGEFPNFITSFNVIKQTIDGPLWSRSSQKGPGSCGDGGPQPQVEPAPDGGVVVGGDLASGGTDGITALSAAGELRWREGAGPGTTRYEPNRLAVSTAGIAVFANTEPACPPNSYGYRVCTQTRLRFRNVLNGTPWRSDVVFTAGAGEPGESAAIMALGIGQDHVYAAIRRGTNPQDSFDWSASIERIAAPGIGGSLRRRVVTSAPPVQPPSPDGEAGPGLGGLPASPTPGYEPPLRLPIHPTAAYVALGDSFSSGEGVEPFFKGTDRPTNICHRSTRAYSRLLDTKRLRLAAGSITSKSFVACSGAIIDDLFDHAHDYFEHVGEGNQVSAVTKKTRLATISIGGNDVQFGDALLRCVSGPVAGPEANGTTGLIYLGFGCRATLERTFQTELDILKGEVNSIHPRLSTVYGRIAKKMAPNGRLLVLNYPSILGADTPPTVPPKNCKVATAHFINRLDVRWLHRKVGQLNAVITSEVREARRKGHNVRVVDVATRFEGHGYCEAKSSDRWFNGLVVRSGKPWAGSFHPNATGQRQMSHAVNAALPSG